MARLQILELPTEHHGDDMVTPWILVVDEVDDDSPLIEEGVKVWPAFKSDTGCRHVLVTTERIAIPANSTGYPSSGPDMVLDVQLGNHVMQSRTRGGDELTDARNDKASL